MRAVGRSALSDPCDLAVVRKRMIGPLSITADFQRVATWHQNRQVRSGVVGVALLFPAACHVVLAVKACAHCVRLRPAAVFEP